MARTLAEVEAALVSVRAAITAAETAQEYASGLGNRKQMADLQVLYTREETLIGERTQILSGGSGAGPVRNYGIRRRL
jgi:hypothetical protein